MKKVTITLVIFFLSACIRTLIDASTNDDNWMLVTMLNTVPDFMTWSAIFWAVFNFNVVDKLIGKS